MVSGTATQIETIASMMSLSVQLLVLPLSILQSKCREQCILISLPSLHVDLLRNCSEVAGSAEKSLKLVVVDSAVQHTALVTYIRAQQVSECKMDVCCEVIGIVGALDSDTARIIHTVAKRSNLNITLVAALPSTLLPATNLDLPNVLDMNPLQNYVEALARCADQKNWTRIGLISDGSYYHQLAAEMLQRRLLDGYGRSVVPYIRLGADGDIGEVFETIEAYGTNVAAVFTDKPTACRLSKEGEKLGLNWPNHAWVVFDSGVSFVQEIDCIMEGVIQMTAKENGETNFAFNEPCTRYMKQGLANTVLGGRFSNLLFDSITAVLSAEMGVAIANISFRGASRMVQFRNGNRLNNISFVQIANGLRTEIARYSSELQLISIFSELGASPSGSRIIIQDVIPTWLIILIVIPSIISFAFITTVLGLYILFRKEKEVKSTSVTVSISMFIGCYGLLLTVPLTLVDTLPAAKLPFSDALCTIFICLGGVGISLSLVMATLFVKFLRIYAIFRDPFSLKKKFWNDRSLLIYIILIISPNVVILVVLVAVDPLRNIEIAISSKRQVTVFESCLSNHTIVWLLVLFIYMLLLIVAVVCIAIKTSNIKRKTFRDTKATNAYAFLAIFVVITGLIYWYFFVSLPSSGSNYRGAELTVIIASYAVSGLSLCSESGHPIEKTVFTKEGLAMILAMVNLFPPPPFQSSYFHPCSYVCRHRLAMDCASNQP
jgi:hypothetical protein